MSSRVWIGRLPHRADERDLRDFFRGYGKLGRIIIKRGFAFIEFDDKRDAEDAVHDLHGRRMMGETVALEVAKGEPRGRDAMIDGREKPRRSDYRIIIKNLSTRVEWPDLKEYLTKHAAEPCFTDAHSRKDREGLAEFCTLRDMQKALKLDGDKLNGRELEIEEDEITRKRRKSNSRSRSRSRSGSGDRRSRSGSARKSRSRSSSKASSRSAKSDRSDKDKKDDEKKEDIKEEKRDSRSPSP